MATTKTWCVHISDSSPAQTIWTRFLFKGFVLTVVNPVCVSNIFHKLVNRFHWNSYAIQDGRYRQLTFGKHRNGYKSVTIQVYLKWGEVAAEIHSHHIPLTVQGWVCIILFSRFDQACVIFQNKMLLNYNSGMKGSEWYVFLWGILTLLSNMFWLIYERT